MRKESATIRRCHSQLSALGLDSDAVCWIALRIGTLDNSTTKKWMAHPQAQSGGTQQCLFRNSLNFLALNLQQPMT